MAERGLSSHRRKRRRQRTRRFVGFLFLFLLSYFLITTFLFKVVRVRDDSMAPTLEPGDILLASPLMHHLEPPRGVARGDLVLLENPNRPDITFGSKLVTRLVHFFTLGKAQGSAASGSRLLLRRVVGLPGERVLLDEYRFYTRTGEGAWVSEETLSGERYELLLPESTGFQTPWPSMNTPGSPDGPAETIPPGSYYLGADNRGGPLDSRFWGSVEASRLEGAVMFRLLPLERFGPLGEEK